MSLFQGAAPILDIPMITLTLDLRSLEQVVQIVKATMKENTFSLQASEPCMQDQKPNAHHAERHAPTVKPDAQDVEQRTQS